MIFVIHILIHTPLSVYTHNIHGKNAVVFFFLTDGICDENNLGLLA